MISRRDVVAVAAGADRAVRHGRRPDRHARAHLCRQARGPEAAAQELCGLVGRVGMVESLGWVLPIDDHSFRIYVVGRVREAGELHRMRSRPDGKKLREELTEEEHQRPGHAAGEVQRRQLDGMKTGGQGRPFLPEACLSGRPGR